MSDKRRGLGRGLGALIPTGTSTGSERPVDVFFPGRPADPEPAADTSPDAAETAAVAPEPETAPATPGPSPAQRPEKPPVSEPAAAKAPNSVGPEMRCPEPESWPAVAASCTEAPWRSAARPANPGPAPSGSGVTTAGVQVSTKSSQYWST